ncbi:MAG: hypothetical protein AN484_24635 [Aphanizomenon flos-aquae WA102]|uniref:Uncharacterized protein n=1 Tax=Aphanizomenon flos-aquae WA102 TaxID=1710896 RepID=A0A1B7WLC2_APHFL|nr:MAG: hypothetical protein AN484_24635 [Aphanizomenon flos-aquae WA102]
MTGPIWSEPLRPGSGTAAMTPGTTAGAAGAAGAAAGAAWPKPAMGAEAAASNRQKIGREARR